MEDRITSPATSGDRASPTLREMFKAHISISRPHLTTYSTTQQPPPQRPRHRQPQPPPTPQHYPRLFGHPHQHAPPQATEPFWHQYPYWTEHPLYYYPELGYLHHPFHTMQNMDRETLKIGFESKYASSQQNRNGQGPTKPKQSTGPKVDIFVGDELVRSIPLKVLTRFSEAGKRVFPRPQQQGATEETFSKKVPTLSAEKVDSILDWAEEANAAVAGGSKDPGSAESNASRVPGVAPISLAYAVPKMQNRTLRLKLDVVEMPSKSAVDDALKWMEANATSDGKLTNYGPSLLHKMELDDLIDLYQAALAFELRPLGKISGLRKEIFSRVSEGKLGISTFKQLSRWLPADDPVIARCINSMEYHRQKGAYTEAEVKEVASFLQLPGNEKLDKACLQILEEWRIKREARRGQQPNRERADSSVSSAKHGGSKEVAPAAQEANISQAEDEKDEKRTPRRRNRRAQKAKGNAN